jgi:hypothetical protein
MTLLTIFTVCWYYTSSKNAVATQQLVENYQEHISITAGSMTAAGGNDRPPLLPCMLHFAMMASLTALQLFVGLCVATFLSWGILSGSCQGSATTVTSSASSSTTPTPPTKRVASYLISSLHYFGCLFTNLGFAYGSASIVQVIKLLEPIETLILTFVVNVCISKLHKKNSVARQGGLVQVELVRALSVIVIVTGTSLLLACKGIEESVNFQTVTFALCSGFAMSSRNVAQKTAKTMTTTTNSTSSAAVGWKEATILGINTFTSITYHAVLLSLVCLAIVEYHGLEGIEGSIVIWMLTSTGKPGMEGIMFHGLYNIASISVLSLVNAQTHSLLNVGKRVSNVLVAAAVFHKPLGVKGVLGLCIAAVGGLVYSSAGGGNQLKNDRSKGTRSKSRFISRLAGNLGYPMKMIMKLSTLVVAYFMYTMTVNNQTVVESTTNMSTTSGQHMSLNVINPDWPLKRPAVRKDCKVSFRNKQMSLCNIQPWKNFGDELGPPLVKRILELHFGCSAEDVDVFDLKKIYMGGGDNGFLNRTGSGLETCLMTVGSLWRMVKSGDHIWGTGVAYNGTVAARCRRRNSNKVDNVTIYSSRGPLSASQIQEFCSQSKVSNSNTSRSTIEGAGDAGFLVPFLFPELKRDKKLTGGEKGQKRKNKCIVPHKKDEQHRAWHQQGEQPVEILTVDKSWVNMTLSLQDCDEVVSSSLHGIILSEALGIASRRLRLSGAPGDFKFADFYASYRGGEPEKVNSLQFAFSNILQPLPYPEREAYAKRVLKTFPMHLFQAIDVKDENK